MEKKIYTNFPVPSILPMRPNKLSVQNINNTIIQQPPIQPLQGLSFAREELKPTTPINPRDILLGLLNN